MEISFVPQESGGTLQDDDDNHANAGKAKAQKERRKGVETFGAGMEKFRDGYEGEPGERSESERKGRTKRRSGMRSGSKNTFRRL